VPLGCSREGLVDEDVWHRAARGGARVSLLHPPWASASTGCRCPRGRRLPCRAAVGRVVIHLAHSAMQEEEGTAGLGVGGGGHLSLHREGAARQACPVLHAWHGVARARAADATPAPGEACCLRPSSAVLQTRLARLCTGHFSGERGETPGSCGVRHTDFYSTKRGSGYA
jgi:hypothetical protein